MLKTAELEEFVRERLKSSRIPIDEIITSDVFFTDKACAAGIFLYFHRKKYCMKFVTQYRSEESVDRFDTPDDLLYSFLKYKISQKAIYETGGYKYKPYAVEIFKSVDDTYYARALTELDNDSW